MTVNPNAVDDTLLATPADTAETVQSSTALSNDIGTTVAVSAVDASSVQGGTVALSSDGSSFVYTPKADYSGPDSFGYTITDASGNTATATEHVAVDPVAKPDAIPALDQGKTATIDASTLLANDRGSNLSITGVSNATRGTVSYDETTQQITFTPTAGLAGNAGFSYTVTDGTTLETTTVVVPVNPAPGDYTTTATSGEGDGVSAADGVLSDQPDGSSASLSTSPHHGSVTVEADGSYVYTPDASYSGPDSFTYTVTNPSNPTATGKVTITVLPLAVAEHLTTGTDSQTPLTIAASTLTGSDNGAHISISQVGTAAGPETGGDATLNGDGSITFTPTAGFSGPVSFDYTITDGTHQSTAPVTLSVTPAANPVTVHPTTDDKPITLPASVFTDAGSGSGLELTSVGDASVGTVIQNTDGTVTYSPQAGFSGTYTFTYTLEDSASQKASGTATIEVDPAAGSLAITAASGQADSVDAAHGLLSPATGASGSSLSVALDTDPGTTASHGTVTLGGGGAFTYTPDTGFSGTDSFDYVVTDLSGDHTAGAVTVTILPAANGFGTSITDAQTYPFSSASLLAQASGSGLTVSVQQPANGSIVDENGDYVYTPASGFSGADTFTYTVTDSHAQQQSATVTVQVRPVAAPDSGTTTANQTLTVDTAHGVLANDDGTLLTAVVKTGVQFGRLTLNKDGSYTYVPNTGFSGTDSFVYTDTDTTGQTVDAIVSIDVDPFVQNSSTSVKADQTAHLDAPGALGGAVGDTLSVTSVDGGNPAGTAFVDADGNSVTIASDGTVDFVPAASYSGADTFSYTVTDASGLTSIGRIVVTVTPRALSDLLSTPADTPLTFDAGDLRKNDFGTGLSISSITPALVGGTVQLGHGTLTQSGTSYTYTPDAGFSGADAFNYTVIDSSNQTVTAPVRIIVGDRASDYTATAPSGGTLVVPASEGVLSNDSGSNLVLKVVQNVSNGSLTLRQNGSYSYAPVKGFSGTDSFTYTIDDGVNPTRTGTLTLTVLPTVTDDSDTTAVNTPLTLQAPGVLSNDSGTQLRVTQVGTPSQGGVATINGSGALVYTPKTNFSGVETITYSVIDENGLTPGAAKTTATVTIHVTPQSLDDSAQTIAGHKVSVDAAHGLLANDTGTLLAAALKTTPDDGTVTVAPDGSYVYTPKAGFAGQDTFTYTATDSSGQVTTSTVTITVLAAAKATNVGVTGTPGAKVTLSPLKVDTPTAGANFDSTTLQLIDPSTGKPVSSFAIPGKGTFAVAAGQVVFSPVKHFAGTASIAYEVSDSADALVSATLTVRYPTPAEAAAAAPGSGHGGSTAPVTRGGGHGTGPGSLAFTGSQGTFGMLLIGLGGLLMGLALVLLRRFRREAPGPRRLGL
ncbi:hypothetical protein AX769_00335 [Frondihabitans sp. PAMC 28766]|uniref:beta strand repeat-containing protein n=1 Tax=Frondihabitans sp. PAMC 28766 TaxID=1795630 RepID=UPI00078CF012|nr:Ig-like domain-containing protein [Frondihabitans sp. PAMC 28766]AMM18869.1 hypothetical protein AX769_00335 [Frondihabitans sp. PAMC 28766]